VSGIEGAGRDQRVAKVEGGESAFPVSGTLSAIRSSMVRRNVAKSNGFLSVDCAISLIYALLPMPVVSANGRPRAIKASTSSSGTTRKPRLFGLKRSKTATCPTTTSTVAISHDHSRRLGLRPECANSGHSQYAGMGQLQPQRSFGGQYLDIRVLRAHHWFLPVGYKPMDVGAWLRGLGLGQYETTFRESEIDAEVLADLTEGDLSQLGVPLGHRKRLLKAIAALGAKETPAKPSLPAPALSSATAERRPITVMFCDLVGSTSLAAKLDAEDWRTLVNTYLDEASAAVTGLDGHVLKKLGDGLMALFGYPHAQENDAERAVRAALAIQRALAEINARNAGKGAPELAARIGLDSGQVVVDATGEVFGDPPNIAARVQSAAEPGSILITAAVQRQTAGLFVAEDRGQHELKGLSVPMTLYRVIRASGTGRRGGARALTPLVGREEELDLLTRRWQRAYHGEGQLALIVGEPGLGKSRLMEEFHGRLGETPHTWVEWSSSQLLQNTPLHPIVEWGRQRFSADLPNAQRLADLENTLDLIGLDPTEYAPLLAPLVDVPLPEGRVARLAPEELRRRQLAAMTAWILAAARTQAVVLAFEDLHWADPTSLDLIRALAERGSQVSLLIIATTRPEFRPTWSSRSHHSVLSLSPLDRVQVAKMVGGLSARHALPRNIVEGVNERTGGVPLFVEEVTRLLLERGEQGGAQAIPPTLQQSLAARLDRLGSARETADRRSAGPRILLRAASIRCWTRRGRAAIGAGTARAGRHSVHQWRWAASELPLQACVDPGCCLRQPAQEPPSSAAQPRSGNPGRTARLRGSRAGSHRPSFQPRWP
jgi:class 3 adenylate cyclase